MDDEEVGKEIRKEERRLGKEAVKFLIEKEHKMRQLKLALQKELQREKLLIHRKYQHRIDKIEKDIKHVVKSGKYMVDTRMYHELKKEFLDRVREEIQERKRKEAEVKAQIDKELDEEERMEQEQEQQEAPQDDESKDLNNPNA